MQPDPRTNLSNQLADTLSNRLVAPDEKREITITFRASYAEKARHSDKEHDHTHIVASRVNNLDGKSIRTWNNYAHSEHSARLLEREFQLTQVQSSWEIKQKAMTRNQLERVERDGLPGEEIMRRAIEQVAVNKPMMPQLIERLWREHQVKSIVSYYGHGGVRGIKFGIDVGSVNEDGSPRLLWKQGGNLRAELYQYYSVGLQNLLVTDRDKEIAILALKDDKPAQDVEEILQASPAGWTQDEARELVLITTNQLVTQKSEPEQSLNEKQRIESEFLAEAVPIAVELINWQLRENGENSLRFKHAILEKQGRELVFTHDERGEIFRVAVNRNQSGEEEYSPINVGEVDREDLTFWQEAERVLQQIREEALRQELRQSKGISL